MNINKSPVVFGAIALFIVALVFYYANSSRPMTGPDQSPLTYKDVLKIDNLKANQVVKSPLVITGQARLWYFEASFPVKLYDGNGKELAAVPAQAQGDWMTSSFVPFKVELQFIRPSTPNGKIVFQKDNPSGLPQNEDKFEVLVKF